MAIAFSCTESLEDLKDLLLNNGDCFYYDVFDCKQGKSILKIDAIEKNSLAKEWCEEKVLKDITNRISNEDIKTFNVSRIIHLNEIVILDVFIKAEYECNVGGETHLDIYIKMQWKKDCTKTII